MCVWCTFYESWNIFCYPNVNMKSILDFFSSNNEYVWIESNEVHLNTRNISSTDKQFLSKNQSRTNHRNYLKFALYIRLKNNSRIIKGMKVSFQSRNLHSSDILFLLLTQAIYFGEGNHPIKLIWRAQIRVPSDFVKKFYSWMTTAIGDFRSFVWLLKLRWVIFRWKVSSWLGLLEAERRKVPIIYTFTNEENYILFSTQSGSFSWIIQPAPSGEIKLYLDSNDVFEMRKSPLSMHSTVLLTELLLTISNTSDKAFYSAYLIFLFIKHTNNKI